MSGRSGEEVPLGERWADSIARLFHETYERLAPSFGYETRPESAVPWEAVPVANRLLMRAVVTSLFDDKAATDDDTEGFWWSFSDKRGWHVLTLRPEAERAERVAHITSTWGQS